MRQRDLTSPVKGRFTLRNICLKLSYASCLQLELYCVNQAHNSTTMQASCMFDLPSTTQVVSMRLHATVIGKSCVI